MERETGSWVSSSTTGESYKAFIPFPLPPDPDVIYDEEMMELRDQANRALGKLDGITTLLPDVSLFLYFYVRKEAVLSSQIEGTQSSFSDLLLYEQGEKPKASVEDVSDIVRYVAALNHGLNRIRGGFPLSLRLIREIHRVLLAEGRGSSRSPGEFRTSQNWIGGTRPGNAIYVPPPPDRLIECMGALEKFLHDVPVRIPVLIKAAMAHAQFETIHPFLDGNGRVGRLLITLLFCIEGVLSESLLYLSLYFKIHRSTYYELLQSIRTRGEWEAWIQFFLKGVIETANQATETSQAVLKLFEEDRQKINTIGRAAGSTSLVHQLAQQNPFLSVPRASDELGLTPPTVNTAIERLIRLGILKEYTGRKRDRIFVYNQYLDILEKGMEPGSGHL